MCITDEQLNSILNTNREKEDTISNLLALNKALSDELDMSQKLVEGYQRKIANDGSVL